MTMNLRAMVDALDLRVLCGEEHLTREVSGGYVSDMLSDVLAHGTHDCIWVTRQSHRNVIAVAALLGLAAVVLVSCPEPSSELVSKAQAEDVVLLYSKGTAFELVGQMYALGIGGCRRA
jgi:serine kinase of HPr protein (carbohydrate metabolism regulator)